MALNDPPQRGIIEHDERDDASDTDTNAGPPSVVNPPLTAVIANQRYGTSLLSDRLYTFN
jgi:hypothetical protein